MKLLPVYFLTRSVNVIFRTRAVITDVWWSIFVMNTWCHHFFQGSIHIIFTCISPFSTMKSVAADNLDWLFSVVAMLYSCNPCQSAYSCCGMGTAMPSWASPGVTRESCVDCVGTSMAFPTMICGPSLVKSQTPQQCLATVGRWEELLYDEKV